MDARYAHGSGGGAGCISRYGVGGGGGCVARYVGDGVCCGLYDVSMVDRLMLQFRPIVPRPAASGYASGGSATEDGGKSGGGKRRFVRVKQGGKRNNDNKKRKASTSSFHASGGGDAMVTLSLMPETPDRKENPSQVVCSSSESFDTVTVNNPSSPMLLSFNNHHNTSRDGHVDLFSDHTAVTLSQPERQQTVSFVTVECVRETVVDWVVVGFTDEQRLEQLDRDTCPGFISDGRDRVVWTNKAYREMASGGEEVAALVVRKDGRWPYPAAFTCNVRVVTCRSGVSSSTLTTPCDAWRMGGGYAWRLDVKAALCLGL